MEKICQIGEKKEEIYTNESVRRERTFVSLGYTFCIRIVRNRKDLERYLSYNFANDSICSPLVRKMYILLRLTD